MMMTKRVGKVSKTEKLEETQKHISSRIFNPSVKIPLQQISASHSSKILSEEKWFRGGKKKSCVSRHF